MDKDKRLFPFRKHPVGDILERGKRKKLKKGMGILLAAALLFNTLPSAPLTAAASEDNGTGLCEHHRSHTEECDYAEAADCTHTHTEECYTMVTDCVHTHTEECMDSDAEGLEQCTHECSEDSGCVLKMLDCHHEHDRDCGYAQAHECMFVCEECSKDDAAGDSARDEADVETSDSASAETQEEIPDSTNREECICEALCTEDSINGDCFVCSVEGADLSVCEGKETDEENTEIIETKDVEIEDTNLCSHHKEHTEDCGYIPPSEDGEGSPCAYECRICPIEELIAALPDKVTEDNAKKVRAQLDKILALYGKLTEEEQEQTDLSRCLELQEALDAANVPMLPATGDFQFTTNGESVIFTEEECGGNCQGHIITQSTNSFAGKNAIILVKSGTHDITFSGLNLTNAKVGVMPGGAMNLTIDGTNSINASTGMAGIYVPVGATLVITEQSTGSLDVSGNGAGIGGSFYAPNGDTGELNCGIVIINGGTIIATGGSCSAGIGGSGGDYGTPAGNGGTVTINGGTVTAAGGDDVGYYGGAGIGGGVYSGKSGNGGTLTINGGLVTLSVGTHNDYYGIAYGFGRGNGSNSNAGTLILADESYLTLAGSTTLDPNGTYRITSNLTADMITVPSDMHYTSADMAAKIAQKVTLSGKEICGQIFKIDMEGWNLSVTKKSDLEYTAVYTHTEKGTVSKPVIILPCLHGDGAALTYHEKVEADCTHTGILEYWDCSVCGKKFSDEDGQTEITDTEIPIAAHTLTHHEKVESDCTHTGVVEYWECSVCGKKFSDKDGQTEITDTEIPIAAHTLTHYEGKEADCTQAGNVEYWDCSVCGKKFSDNGGQTEISDTDVEIEVKPHTLAHHARVEAGCLTEGNIEYWSCGVCDKLFSDKGGTKEVTDIKIPAAEHNYSGWQSNGNGTHTRTCQTQDCGFAETEDCSGGTASYIDKAVCTVCRHEYGELLKDSDAPTGEISISTSKWNSFLNTITFGLFFKNTEKVTITAEDQESGVKSVSYYISDRGMSEEEVKALTTEWSDVDGDTATFNISEDKSCMVYAKITDKQGNVTYISSDGMVFDGTAPAITGVENGKTYCEKQAVTVTDENLESVTINSKTADLQDGGKELSLTLEAASGVQTIEAKDKAGNTVSVTVTLAHTLTHYESKDADCTQAGNVEYWSCSVCGKKFSDKDGQTEITDTEIPTTAHTMVHHEGKDADCTQAGNVEYWSCSVCGKKFSDKDGQKEISDADVEIPSKPHTLTHHTGTEAGCLTEGNIEYWDCSVCGKLFSDQDGTKEVTDVKIPAAGHHYSDWQGSGNGTHTRTCQTQGCGFTETGNCSGGTASYTNKAVCEICNHEYGELLEDSGAPTGEISISTSKWNSFLNTIMFGLFFKNTEKVTITAEDQESGVKFVSYYISEKEMSEEEVKALTTEWTNVDGNTVTFNISGDKSCVVYAKITDNQGNVTYISSDGMVFDGTAPSIAGVENDKIYCKQQTVTVTDNNLESVTVNGKEVTLTDDKFILDAASGVQIIEAKDKAGNTMKVTVNMGHRYGTEWKSNETQHWHECSNCNEKSDIAAHTKDRGTVTKAPTETEMGVRTYHCTVCGCYMGEEDIAQLPPSHTHEFGVDWKKDTENHWHECSGCGERSESAAHIRDSGTVTKEPTETEAGIRIYCCSVCGYKMDEEVIDPLLPSHTHNYSTEWILDSSRHWHECNCGEKSESAVHTKDSGTVTKPPTETETGIKTYHCSVCGYEMGEEVIDKLSPSHTHKFSTDWKTNSSRHWHECNCGEKSESAVHTKDSGTVTKPSTETETGIKTYHCSVCGYEMGEEVIDKLSPSHTHKFSTDWKTNSSRHWHECNCGEKSESAVHTKDSGTVTKPPTETETGIKTYHCSVCGYEMGEEVIEKLSPTHKHSYSAEWKTNNSRHWHECSCGEKSDSASHSSDGGTVTKKPTKTETGIRTYKCTVCGYAWTEKIAKLPSSSGDNNGSDNNGNRDNGQENNNNENKNNIPETQPTNTPPKDTVTTPLPAETTTPVKPETDTTKPGNGTAQDNTPQSGNDTSGSRPFIKGADGKTGWDVIRAEEEKTEDGEVINVDMNGSTVVPGDIFDRIGGRDVTITFDMGNGIIWSMDGKSVTTDKSDDIDFSVKTGGNAIPVDIVNNVTGERYSIQLSLVHEGEFGFTAVLSINLGRENAGLTASLYYYNESAGELEFISSEEVAEDGTVSLAFTHASDYVIAVGEEEGSGDISSSEATETPESETTGDNEELPQTGQPWKPWWFVVIGVMVVVIGMICVVFVMKKKKEDA